MRKHPRIMWPDQGPDYEPPQKKPATPKDDRTMRERLGKRSGAGVADGDTDANRDEDVKPAVVKDSLKHR